MGVGLCDPPRINGTCIDRHKTVPKTKKIVRQKIDRFFARFLGDRRFFFDDSKVYQRFEVLRHHRVFFTNFCGDVVQARSPLCNCLDDCIINCRLTQLLL